VQSLDGLFRVGVRYSWPSGTECETGLVAAGEVSLPTGSIVVADPDWAMSPLEEADVVAAVVAPGRYAVALSVATWRQSPNPALPSPMRKVCAAKVKILNEKVVSWRPARTSKASDAEDPLGIPVDSGTAAFFDFSAREWLSGLQSDDQHWKRALEYMDRDLYAYFEDQQTSANVVMFECGMGDGVYDVWLGLTRDGETAEIVIDLELLSHSLGPSS
jgi:Protein of unknown function (DUF4241)